MAHYLTSHLSPVTVVHGHPAPSVIGMSLIHGYTTGFWVAAAIGGAGAVTCGTLFRFGPLRASGRDGRPGQDSRAAGHHRPRRGMTFMEEAMLAPTRGPRAQRSFLLQRAQPAITGLIDGALSTLAPIFAIAFATHRPHDAFLAGLATAIGAGIAWPSPKDCLTPAT